MPQDNAAIVRTAYERWSDGDFAGDVSFFDPEVSYVIGPGFPDTGIYSGLEEVGKFLEGWIAAWDTASLEAREIVDAGQKVLVAVRLNATGHASGITGDLFFFHVWTMRGGKVIRLEAIRDRTDALKAAGLPI